MADCAGLSDEEDWRKENPTFKEAIKTLEAHRTESIGLGDYELAPEARRVIHKLNCNLHHSKLTQARRNCRKNCKLKFPLRRSKRLERERAEHDEFFRKVLQIPDNDMEVIDAVMSGGRAGGDLTDDMRVTAVYPEFIEFANMVAEATVESCCRAIDHGRPLQHGPRHLNMSAVFRRWLSRIDSRK